MCASTDGSVPRPRPRAASAADARPEARRCEAGRARPSSLPRPADTGSSRLPLRDAAPPGDARTAPGGRSRPGACCDRAHARARRGARPDGRPRRACRTGSVHLPGARAARDARRLLADRAPRQADRGRADPRVTARRPHPGQPHRRTGARARRCARPGPDRGRRAVPRRREHPRPARGEELRRRAAAGGRRRHGRLARRHRRAAGASREEGRRARCRERAVGRHRGGGARGAGAGGAGDRRDPAEADPDLRARRRALRRPVGAARVDQQVRDRLRREPVRVERRSRRLDAVPSVDLEALRGRRERRREGRSVQPARRDQLRGPLPRRGRECARTSRGRSGRTTTLCRTSAP